MVFVYICVDHHQMKKQLFYSSKEYSEMVKEAANLSVRADNNDNPVFSLVDASRAEQIILTLHKQFGPERASELTCQDTLSILKSIQKQRERHENALLIASNSQHKVMEHELMEIAGFSV